MDLAQVATNEVFKDTFFQELFETIQEDKFVDPKEEVKTGEEVIDKMNKLEKALFTLMTRYQRIGKDIIKKFRDDVKKLFNEEKPRDPEEIKRLKKTLKKYKERYEIADKILWANIEERLCEKDKTQSAGWGVRKNFQIVLLPEEEIYHEAGRYQVLTILGGMPV